jgi:hypothetical protein
VASRVKWSPEEVRLISDAVARWRLEDPTAGFLWLVNRAQRELLPRHRRRLVKELRVARAVADSVTAQLRALVPALCDGSHDHDDSCIGYVVAKLLACFPNAESKVPIYKEKLANSH